MRQGDERQAWCVTRLILILTFTLLGGANPSIATAAATTTTATTTAAVAVAATATTTTTSAASATTITKATAQRPTYFSYPRSRR